MLQLLEGRSPVTPAGDRAPGRARRRRPGRGRVRARGLVLGAACAAAIACSGARRAAPSSAPPAAEAGPAPRAAAPGDPRAEIDALDREIAAALARAGIAPPLGATCSGASCQAAMAEPFTTPSPGDATCHPAPVERCHDTCTLATSICRNQERICDLAGQLGDDWAAGRCTRARASCRAAHERCCSCAP